MGEVYWAQDVRLGRPVALEVLVVGKAENERSRERLLSDFGSSQPDFAPPEYGLGLTHDQLANQDAWRHGGDITGFHAEAWHLPKSRVTITALANLRAGPVIGSRQDQIARDLADTIANGN